MTNFETMSAKKGFNLMKDLCLNTSSDTDSSESDNETPWKKRAIEFGKTKVDNGRLDGGLSSELNVDVDVKPSPKLNIFDDGREMKQKKRFTLWSDILFDEQREADGINAGVSLNSVKNKKLVNAEDRNIENYNFWNQPLPHLAQQRRRPRPRAKRSQSAEPSKRDLNELQTTEVGCGDLIESCSLTQGQRKRKKKPKKKRSKDESMTEFIATRLAESNVDLIRKTVKEIGCEKAFKIFNKVMVTETSGGLMTVDNKRRKSPGGVFFTLLKTEEDITKEQINQIFGDTQQHRGQRKKREKREKRRTQRRLTKIEHGFRKLGLSNDNSDASQANGNAQPSLKLQVDDLNHSVIPDSKAETDIK